MIDLLKINDIRTELRDRFGEYPSEGEHLFKIIELRIIASQFRITRLELHSSLLTLSLPNKDDSLFYGIEQKFYSHLNRLIANIQNRHKTKARLKEEPLILKFVLNRPHIENQLKRIDEATIALKELFI